MSHKVISLTAATLLLLSGCGNDDAAPVSTLHYPAAKTVDHVDDYHGTKVADPYRWLEDDNSAETKAWVQEQQALTSGYLNQIPGRDKLQKRIGELWDYARQDLPLERGGREFYFRNDGLQNQSVLYVKESVGGPERVLLDPNQLSADGTVALNGVSVSPDGKTLAYGVSKSGSDWQTWEFRNVDDGADLSDTLEWLKFSGASWTADNQGVYYSRYDAPAEGSEMQGVNYFQKLYFHRMGTAQDQDELVYERQDQKEWGFGGDVTDDGQYLVITVSQGTDVRNRLFYKKLGDSSAVVELLPELEAEYLLVGNKDDVFYIKTNKDAPNGRIIAIDLKQPQPEHWTTVVPENAKDVIEQVKMTGDTLVVNYMADVLSKLVTYKTDGSIVGEVALPGKGRVASLEGSEAGDHFYYLFNSYLQAPTVYKVTLADLKQEVEFAPKLAYNPDDFVSEQVFYTSKDGTRVPMILSYRKGLKKDASNPTLLYGYGGFNIPVTPRYSSALVAWMEMGGIYAVANMRGGAEYGEAWHEAGMLHKKQNVFDDFIAAAEYLIAEKYTQSAKLGIYGRSNGGLLIGAALTQRPDLFAVALPAVGVLDMLRFHKFTIGWAWTSEYGSSDSADDFPYLKAYSPLHNVHKQAYPATMVMTADHDDRVVPAHSFKFAATLQADQQGDKPVIARIEHNAGHGAGKPTAMQIAEWTDIYAFLMHNMGEDARLTAIQP